MPLEQDKCDVWAELWSSSKDQARLLSSAHQIYPYLWFKKGSPLKNDKLVCLLRIASSDERSRWNKLQACYTWSRTADRWGVCVCWLPCPPPRATVPLCHSRWIKSQALTFHTVLSTFEKISLKQNLLNFLIVHDGKASSPEAFSKRLATEHKLAKYAALENMGSVDHRWKLRICTYYGGNFLTWLFFKKTSSAIVPTPTIKVQLTALHTQACTTHWTLFFPFCFHPVFCNLPNWWSELWLWLGPSCVCVRMCAPHLYTHVFHERHCGSWRQSYFLIQERHKTNLFSLKNNHSIKLNDTNLTALRRSEGREQLGGMPTETGACESAERRDRRPAPPRCAACGLGQHCAPQSVGWGPSKSWAQTLISKLAGAENTANVTLAAHWREELWVKEAKKNRATVKT